MNNNKKNYQKSDYEIEKLIDFFCSFVFNFSNVSVESLAELEGVFQFLLKLFDSSRCSIYEIEKDSLIKVFELRKGDESGPHYSISKKTLSLIKPYLKTLEKGRSLIVDDIESIKGTNPGLYKIKKEQGFTSFLYSPLLTEGKLIGFIVMDNGHSQKIRLGTDFLERIVNCISHYIKRQISNRKNVKRLSLSKNLKEEDRKLSRPSLNLIQKDLNKTIKLGLIYYSPNTKLRDMNQIKRESYTLINNCFPHQAIYSLREGEFLVVCKNVAEEEFYHSYDRLQKAASHLPILMKSSWKDRNIDFETQFHRLRLNILHTKRSSCSIFEDIESSYSMRKNNTAFHNYIQNNFFDAEVLIHSIANPNSLNYIYFGDLQTSTFYISDNMVKRFGFESNIVENFLEVWESRIYTQKEMELYKADIGEILGKRKNVHNLRYRVRDANGDKVWIHCQGEVLWDRQKKKQLFFSGCISCQEDEYLIDPITSFPRESFAIRKLSGQVEDNCMIRIIGFSLNNFNEINELWGKNKGDMLLGDISRQLTEEYNGKLHFYRLDGLRFAAIYAPNFDDCEKDVINEIREIILKYYRSHNVTVQSPCSFCYMTAKPTEMPIQEMISNTILLINIAKASLEDNFIAYSAQSIKEKKHYAEMVLEITKNIQNDFENFRLVVQPTFTVDEHKIKGGEALLRWKFKGVNISPAEFIPILEKTKLINVVGRWVLRNVVAITKNLLDIQDGIKLSFNVSYTQIYDEDFFDYLAEVLDEYEVDAAKLVLELTETNFNENPQRLADFFNTCIGYGLNLALDDFGSGYSSIGLLLKYPTSIVKLDKSLLYEISHSDVNQKFIKSIINSCHLFGKEVCAEGVETKLELDMMREAECDIIQGFYLSKPLELPEFFKLLIDANKI